MHLLTRTHRSSKAILGAALLAMTAVPSSGDTLIYYNGTGSGTTVTNLGTLGAAGNGTIMTAGTGAVEFIGSGGPFGAGDGFFNLTNSVNNGARIDVPVAGLPSLTNSSWSITGWFNRTNTSTHDMIVHFGSGDGYGQEEELYLWGLQGQTSATLHNYNPEEVNLSHPATLGNWHFFALTFAASGAGTGTLSFYLDGLAPLTDDSFTLQFGNTFRLGGVAGGATVVADRDFLGGLDEFAFYNEVLSSSQIAGLYAGTVTPLTVPEPGTAVTLLAGLALFGQFRRRRG